MITFNNITKSYVTGRAKSKSQLLILDDVSFEVPDGQFLCLLGPSGCGKTTLIRVAAGLTEVDAGSVQVDGTAIKGPGPDRALVFQSYGLLPWRSVLKNVEFGMEMRGVPAPQRRTAALAEIERVGLQGFESHFPHEISGGMQQRVGIARALAKDPRILLMDEPFAAVDMQTRETLQDELLKLWREFRRTVIFVTHSIDEALYLADRVIVMQTKPGRIVADLTVDLPRPRSQHDIRLMPRFAELQQLCRDALVQSPAASGGDLTADAKQSRRP